MRAVAGVLVALVLALGAQAAADVRRMEAVGAAPIRIGTRNTVSVRDAALRRALGDAVLRVAHELLAPEGDEEPAEAPPGSAPVVPGAEDGDPAAAVEALEARLAEALGDDPLDYAVRFRILEDRGERPALFVDDPEVESEYVIVVEVFVDTEQVRRRLDRRGFSLVPSGEEARVQTLLELVGIERFDEYEMVRSSLAGDARVRSVVPLEIERGRAVLAVDSGHGPEALLERLYEVVPPQIDIEPLGIDEGRLTLRVNLRAPELEPGAVAAPGD